MVTTVEYLKVVVLTEREYDIELNDDSQVNQVVFGYLEKKYQAKLMQ
jgi:hypothetical protein